MDNPSYKKKELELAYEGRSTYNFGMPGSTMAEGLLGETDGSVVKHRGAREMVQSQNADSWSKGREVSMDDTR